MWVRPLGPEDPLEKGTATHSSILAWEIPWTEEPGGLRSMGLQKSWTRLKRRTWDRPQGQDLRPQGPMDRVSKTESQGRTRRWKPHLTWATGFRTAVCHCQGKEG